VQSQILEDKKRGDRGEGPLALGQPQTSVSANIDQNYWNFKEQGEDDSVMESNNLDEMKIHEDGLKGLKDAFKKSVERVKDILEREVQN